METLLNMLPIIQIVLAVILVGAILLQQRGAGLGGAFGGDDGGVHYERRGFERTLFKATMVVAIVFVASVMISVITSDSSNVGSIAPPPDNDIMPNSEDITVETNTGEGAEIIPIESNEADVIDIIDGDASADVTTDESE